MLGSSNVGGTNGKPKPTVEIRLRSCAPFYINVLFSYNNAIVDLMKKVREFEKIAVALLMPHQVGSGAWDPPSRAWFFPLRDLEKLTAVLKAANITYDAPLRGLVWHSPFFPSSSFHQIIIRLRKVRDLFVNQTSVCCRMISLWHSTNTSVKASNLSFKGMAVLS